MRAVVANLAYDADVPDPGALLSSYHSLTGWCEALAGCGVEVTAVQRFHTEATIERSGITYHLYDDASVGEAPWWPRRCQRLVKDAAPDLVHVNGLAFPVQTWMLRRTVGSATAIVVQDHASGAPAAPGGSPLRAAVGFARRRLMRSADGFLFTAAAQADAWRQAGLIADWQPVYEVLEASTNMKPVSRQLAKQESGLDGDPAILWVGRLNANKDPLTVLDGFERTLAELPSSTLSMVFSSGGLLPEVRARLERSPALGSRVRLVGPVAHNRMAAFYSAADLFVVGSHHEGSGYAVLEAVSSGLSPVITSIPPFRVITAGGAIGMLWPPGDSRACADALVRAAAERRPEARERVLERFERDLSWRAVARSAIAAYEDACARRRSKYA